MTAPVSLKRARPVEPDVPPEPLKPLDILTSSGDRSKRVELKEETDRTLSLTKFVREILPSLNGTYEERLNSLLGHFDFCEVEPKEAPSGIRAELWLKDERGKVLFASIFEKAFYSTSFIEPDDKRLELYFSVSEFVDDDLVPDNVEIRFSPQTFEGEWIWIRNSKNFSGNASKMIAQAFTVNCLASVVLWDSAKVFVQKEEFPLSPWLVVARNTPETFYSKLGFVPKDLVNFQGLKDTFTQSNAAFQQAQQSLRQAKTTEIRALLNSKDKLKFDAIAAKYPDSETFHELCKEVDEQDKGSKDHHFLYQLISNRRKFLPSKDNTELPKAIRTIFDTEIFEWKRGS